MPVDYSKYPKNWFSVIRPAILARANNCCEFCKVPNGKWILRGEWGDREAYQDDDGTIFDAETGERIGDDYVGEVDKGNKMKPMVKVVLTIMHLDHDVTNNDPSNLKAACQLHHLRYDKEHHGKTRKENKKKIQPNLF